MHDDKESGIDEVPVWHRALVLAFLTVPPIVWLSVGALGGSFIKATNVAIGVTILVFFVIPLALWYVIFVLRLAASIVGSVRKAIAPNQAKANEEFVQAFFAEMAKKGSLSPEEAKAFAGEMAGKKK